MWTSLSGTSVLRWKFREWGAGNVTVGVSGPVGDFWQPGTGMSTFLPFVVIGLTSGSIYGLAAVGLVLTYKTSGIFNFAHGSIAAIAAFVFYFLYQQHHVAWLGRWGRRRIRSR
jgi:ABC-type branched-subunit amino acid transport system permease subunit